MAAQLLRVQNFGVSRDGYGAGEGQSAQTPFGHADPASIFAWAGATASWPNRMSKPATLRSHGHFTGPPSLDRLPTASASSTAVKGTSAVA